MSRQRILFKLYISWNTISTLHFTIRVFQQLENAKSRGVTKTNEVYHWNRTYVYLRESVVEDLIPLQQPDPPALMTRDTPTFTRPVGNKSQCVRRFRNIILRPSRLHRFCKRTMSYHGRVLFPCRSNWPIVRALKLPKKRKLSVCSTWSSKCIDVYTYHHILTKIPISELYSGYV